MENLKNKNNYELRVTDYELRKYGFTLIEIMIAISVMTIGILAVYALVPKIISISLTNVNEFIAAQLAKEGLEIVRNIRDTNWLKATSDWDAGLTNCSGGCEIDYNDSTLSSFQGRYLKIDNDGFYNYENGSDSNPKFKRKITITKPQNYILNVKVEIEWGKENSFEIQENLYNWRQIT